MVNLSDFALFFGAGLDSALAFDDDLLDYLLGNLFNLFNFFNFNSSTLNFNRLLPLGLRGRRREPIRRGPEHVRVRIHARVERL